MSTEAPALHPALRASSGPVLVAKVTGAVLGVGVNALLARLLSPAEVGTYFVGLTLVSFLVMAVAAGPGQAGVRLLAEHRTAADGLPAAAARWLLRRGLVTSVVTGAAVVALAPALGSVLPPLRALGPLLLGVWVAASLMQRLVAELFRGSLRLTRAVVLIDITDGGTLCRALLCALLAAALLGRGSASLSFALGASAAVALAGLAVAWPLLRCDLGLREDGERFSPEGFARAVRPLTSVNVTSWLFTQADVWLLAAFAPPAEVGVYAAAAKLMVAVFLPLNAINALVPPLVAELSAAGEHARLERTLRAAAALAGLPAAAAATLLMVFGPQILGALYGEEYRAGAPVLALLAGGQLVRIWAGPADLTLMMAGLQQRMQRISLVTGAATLAAGALGAWAWHGTGVALAVACGLAAASVTAVVTARRHLGLDPTTPLSRRALTDVWEGLRTVRPRFPPARSAD